MTLHRYGPLGIMGFGRKKNRPDKRYPGFNWRMLAATIDSAILLLLAPIVDRLVPINQDALLRYRVDPNDPDALRNWVTSVLSDPDFVVSWTNNLVGQIMLFFAYSAFFWHFFAATPGKMLLRMKVVDARTEQPISDLQIVLRLFGYVISATFLFIGFFWIGFDKRRQSWHDKLADTVVITAPWRRPKPTPGSEAAGPSDSQAPSAGG